MFDAAAGRCKPNRQLDGLVRNGARKDRRTAEMDAETLQAACQAVAGALSRVVAIAGGWLGARTVDRLYAVEMSRRTTVGRG